MPIYRYKCNCCNSNFEKIMNISDRFDENTEIICPLCGSTSINPVINKSSFSLKGGGWYRDGYSQSNKSKK